MIDFWSIKLHFKIIILAIFLFILFVVICLGIILIDFDSITSRFPNTEYAKNGYEFITGLKPDSAISNIYYRDYDFCSLLSFSTSDKRIIERIIKLYDLKKGAEKKEVYLKITYPKWWYKNDTSLIRYCDSINCNFIGKCLWYDSKKQTVYYEYYNLS